MVGLLPVGRQFKLFISENEQGTSTLPNAVHGQVNKIVTS
jgi:hypothetical protein